jgi:4-amino-4-deoxychorismate lyase
MSMSSDPIAIQSQGIPTLYQAGESQATASEDEPYVYATVLYDPSLTKHPENTKVSFGRPSPFYLLEHQWTRLQVANWSKDRSPNSHGSPSVFYNSLVCAIRKWYQENPDKRPTCLRIKVRAYQSGPTTFHVRQPSVERQINLLFPKTFGVPSKLPTTQWTTVLDNRSTEVSESTMMKTSDRMPYARPRAAAQIPSMTGPKEVLLYNPEGNILDGSTSTPFFFRNGRWVVPISSSGGLQGTTRRWALENGLAVEAVVPIKSLEVGETVWLSNAVWGFYHSIFVARDEPEVSPTHEDCCRPQ